MSASEPMICAAFLSTLRSRMLDLEARLSAGLPATHCTHALRMISEDVSVELGRLYARTRSPDLDSVEDRRCRATLERVRSALRTRPVTGTSGGLPLRLAMAREALDAATP